MAKVITAILTADEDEVIVRATDGAHQLVYPIHLPPSHAVAEAMSPNAIVDVLLQMDDEDLIDVLHQFVPEMALEAWLMAIRRERQLRIDIPERRS